MVFTGNQKHKTITICKLAGSYDKEAEPGHQWTRRGSVQVRLSVGGGFASTTMTTATQLLDPDGSELRSGGVA